jgi:hypothetical protein
VTILIAAIVMNATTLGQAPFDVRELADYRLTIAAFRQFQVASRLIAATTRREDRFAGDPLFTREILLVGEAREMAAALERRLRTDPDLAEALRPARMPAREYTKFALALFGAHLAHGFVASGALRGVPPGVTADNVAFVEAHRTDIAAVLTELGIAQ